jgi:hypothetical protein
MPKVANVFHDLGYRDLLFLATLAGLAGFILFGMLSILGWKLLSLLVLPAYAVSRIPWPRLPTLSIHDRDLDALALPIDWFAIHIT